MRTIIRDNYTPKNGDYHEVILIDEAQNKQWVFDCDGVFTPFSGEVVNVVSEFGDSTEDAISQKFFTDTTYELQDEIAEIKNNPDVVDIVDTYADLQNYDTSSLGDRDIVRVLTDENHDDESTYYRWDKPNNQWVFIGAVEGYYTKAQTDTLLAGKQDALTAGTNITINNNEISATDTTYNDFVGTDGSADGEAGLVPAPQTTDAGKYLKADGTWDTVNTEQSDWAENDSSDQSYILNRTHYVETIDSAIAHDPNYEAFSGGATPDASYTWYIQQVQDYSLASELSDFADGDTIQVEITYSVNGTEKTDSAQFIYSITGGEGSLDSDMPAGSRWNGAYATEISPNTTFRWPVANTDTGTIYLTNVKYERVKQLDAKYIPVDGDTVIVNANGKLEANVQGGPTVVQTTGTSTTDVMSQNATTSMVFADPVSRHQVQIGNGSTTSANSTIAIGKNSKASAISCIAIGGESIARNNYAAIAIGAGAFATGKGSVALGGHSTASTAGEVNIGIANGSDTSYGYNSSNYRLITGVYDPQSDHDAATKGYTDSLVINYATLNGSSAPTTSTAGEYVGQLYYDTTNDQMYYLSAIDETVTPTTYTWSVIGGSSINVVQTVGTSTTDVMSQDATTKLIFPTSAYRTVAIGNNVIANGSNYQVVIGANARASTAYNYGIAIGAGSTNQYSAQSLAASAIAIGAASKSEGDNSISLGVYASANAAGAVAIGRGSLASSAGQFDISATGQSTYGYNGSQYRLLTGLYDAQNDHDAVTLGQMNTAIASVSVNEINSTDWSNLWQ